MIKAYIFDMGGTLEDVFHKPEMNRSCGEAILGFLRAQGIALEVEPEEFIRRMEASCGEYRAWGMESLRDLTPYEIWSEWHLKDYQVDPVRLRIIADQVANLWERGYYSRALRPQAPELLKALEDRGYLMGIISNTGSQTQVVEILREYGIRSHFSAVYLSCLSGYRKPHPGLFLAVAAQLGLMPGECAYVGDTISRDVRGSRAAGYGASIRIQSHLTRISDERYNTQAEEADYLVENLLDILRLEIAGGREPARAAAAK